MTSTIKEENHVIIIPGKNIVVSMGKEFKIELKALVQELSCDLIIDFTGVNMIDSVGIGIIVAAYNSLTCNGNELKLINLNEDIYGLFKTISLDRHFSIEKAG